MDVTFGLSQYGPEYALIGMMVTAIIYLYRKLVESKEDQIKQSQIENERIQDINEALQRTTDNIFTFVQSHSCEDSISQRSKQFDRLVNRSKKQTDQDTGYQRR